MSFPRLFLLFSCLSTVSAYAQNSLYFSQYFLNLSNDNVAWNGSQGDAFVSIQYRNQWTGYNSSFDGENGAPNSQLATLVVPVRNFPISSVGLIFQNDQLGKVRTNSISVPLTYSKVFRRGEIHTGISAEVMFKEIGTSFLRPNEYEDFGSSETQASPNMRLGLYYFSNSEWSLGLGINNLLEPSFQYTLSKNANIEDLYFSLHGCKIFRLTNDVEMKTSFIFRSDFSSITYDIGSVITLKEMMWAGLSFRKSESVILVLGFDVMQSKSLKVGVSYDYVVRKNDAKSKSSHEIFFQYTMPDFVFGGRKSIKTPRFTN